jgi:hypothetical protein
MKGAIDELLFKFSSTVANAFFVSTKRGGGVKTCAVSTKTGGGGKVCAGSTKTGGGGKARSGTIGSDGAEDPKEGGTSKFDLLLFGSSVIVLSRIVKVALNLLVVNKTLLFKLFTFIE